MSGLLLFSLAACSGNSFISPDAPSKGAAAGQQDDPPPRTDLPLDSQPAPDATPIPAGTHPINPIQVAKIYLTITAPGPTEINLEVELNQSNQTYTAKFTETILGTNVGGCTVGGAAADFSKLSQSLAAVQVGSPTASLQGLADATLKLILLNGSTLSFRLSLTDLDPSAVTSTIPMADAQQLINYIDQLQVETQSCNIL